MGTKRKSKQQKINDDYPWLTSFKYRFFRGKDGYSLQALDFLADTLTKWVKHSEDIITFKEFLNLQELTSYNFIRMAKKSEKLQRAKEFAMQVIGTNREKKAFYKKADYRVMAMTQYVYDPDWAKAEERQHKLKMEQDKGSITKEDLDEAVGNILKSVSDDPDEG